MQNPTNDGFTLVELLLVIVILGILAAIVVAAVGNTSSNAAKNACLTEIKTVRSAIERYVAQNPGTSRASFVNNSTANSSLQPNYLADTITSGGNYTITVSAGAVTGATAGGSC